MADRGNSIETGDEELDARIGEWLAWDRNAKTLKEVEAMVAAKEYGRLRKILTNRLSFGTAGLRGEMAPGFARMNDLVIVQTGQGLLKYLEELDADRLEKGGIVVGYDGRYNSKRWADLTATIFLNKNYPVHLFGDLTPTPFVPYAVTKFECAMGVMITASHNPKEDNGYKVYAANGCQIASPADSDIQRHIMRNLEPLEESWNADVVADHPKRSDPLKETFDSYVRMIEDGIYDDHLANNKKCGMKFVYTPMHGVGQKYVERVMETIGLGMVPVKEQMKPDPDFPTVRLPNPEEGRNALDLSISTANKNNISVILANDPDADRLACAEKNPHTGDWKIFNGNELGALLGWWAFRCHQLRDRRVPLRDVFMVASTVSSKILRTMALREGFNFAETLTGFKWMGGKACSLRRAGQKTIFAFEEAIGFMWGEGVLDKDGVQAAAHLATMAAWLKTQEELTLSDKLEEIYKKYGYHLSLNNYYLCYEPETVAKIFRRLRNFRREERKCCDPPPSLLPVYPEEIDNGKYKIVNIRDLTIGYDTSKDDKKATLPIQKNSQMITFEFENGMVATLRTSGTEPKIKYYTEMIAKPGQGNREEIETLLQDMVLKMNEEFLEPTKNGLKPPQQ